LKFDETRQVWVILARSACCAGRDRRRSAQLCDGIRSVEEMIDQLAEKYTAERSAIEPTSSPCCRTLRQGISHEAREKTS